MKTFAVVAAAALSASGVSAHYKFDQFTAGTDQFPVYEYIRQNTNMDSPVTDLNSTDLRCNVGAQASAATTATVAMTAGEAFTFTLNQAVYHQGPISLYMSEAPGNVSDYDGSGDWFNIHNWGPDFSSGTATWDMADSYSYTIPKCVKNGQYLLRIQSLAIHNPWPAGVPQFYIACAQVDVTGGDGTADPQTALIPGFVKQTDPGYTVNIYDNFHNYTVPGPAPLTC
ncbi:glycoside hydrolase [Xylariaceae sp. FL0804]|nr:glycoside hydrolase [Xylariaceae sp. FL0804]